MMTYKVASIITYVLSLSLVLFALNDSNDLRFTAEEKLALAKLKTTVENSIQEDFMRSDFYLIRWLQKADLSIPIARNWIAQTIQWREQNDISNILSEDWSDLEEKYPTNFDGHDKFGRPILTIDIGKCDLRAAATDGNVNRFQRYLTYTVEKLHQKVFETQQGAGTPATRGIVIMDANGLSFWRHACPTCIGFVVKGLVDKEMYYPSITDEIIGINVPPLGIALLNVCRAVISRELNAQVKVFNSNKKIWQSYLDDRIERSERAANYGGTKQ